MGLDVDGTTRAIRARRPASVVALALRMLLGRAMAAPSRVMKSQFAACQIPYAFHRPELTMRLLDRLMIRRLASLADLVHPRAIRLPLDFAVVPACHFLQGHRRLRHPNKRAARIRLSLPGCRRAIPAYPRTDLIVLGHAPSQSRRNALRVQAQMTVDHAETRYFIVHLHRLLDPEAN